MKSKRHFWAVLNLFFGLVACDGKADTSQPKQDPEANTPKVEQLSLKGVANVYRHSDKILSDGQPDSENGLAELKKIGVQTIISEVSFSRKQLINQARH